MVAKKVVFLKSFLDSLNTQKVEEEAKVKIDAGVENAGPDVETVEVIEAAVLNPEVENEKPSKKKKSKKSV